MKSYVTDLATKAQWDKPIELPKPGRPEMPVTPEPVTPGRLPEPPQTIPDERPEPNMPTEMPDPEKPEQ